MLHNSTVRKLDELIKVVEKNGGNCQAARRKVAPIFCGSDFSPNVIGKWLSGLDATDAHWSTTVPLLFSSRGWNIFTAMHLVESVSDSVLRRTDELNPKVLLEREFCKSHELDPQHLDNQLRILERLISLVRTRKGCHNTEIFRDLFFQLISDISLPHRRLAKKFAVWVSSNTVGCEKRSVAELTLIYRSIEELARSNC